LRTPLFPLIAAQKAKLTDFSGWEMPVQFSSVLQEHEAVRTGVGMFDISHMGKFALQGADIIPALNRLVPSNLAKLHPGEAQYTVLLNPEGGIIDDIIFYCQGSDRAFLIVNAATLAKDKLWLEQHCQNSDVTLTDLSPSQILLALQGSKSEAVLQQFVKDDLSKLKLFRHLETTLLGANAFIARTGYTGEDGFEIMLCPEVGKEFWQALLKAGVTPCGLGARDTLRLEAALSLYGQDIDEQTSPLEAGLGWLVHLKSKGDFIGRTVLETQKASGVKQTLVGLEMQGKHIARHGYPVLAGNQVIGTVTSGSLAPSLGKAIALAYVPPRYANLGEILGVEIRGKTYPALVVPKPFYRRVESAL
jgi:aminomethyltransferase